MKINGIRSLAFALLLLCCLPIISVAQEWSEEQKEVWQLSVKMHRFWAERNLDAYMDCLHKNYMGWFQKNPLPIDKNSLRKWEAINFNTQKILRYEIRPISITLTDDVAVVNFYFNALREDVNGKKLTHTKATRFCIKENDEWLVLGVRATRIFDE